MAVRQASLHLGKLRRINILQSNGAGAKEAAKAAGVFWKQEAEMLRQARAWTWASAALLFTLSGTAYAQSVDLKSAVEVAVESHPEINQAAMNKEAIEFEREQAQGLMLQVRPDKGTA